MSTQKFPKADDFRRAKPRIRAITIKGYQERDKTGVKIGGGYIKIA